MKKSKLHLQRQTLRPLSMGSLGGVLGGETTGPNNPAVKSYVLPTGTVDPCRAEDSEICMTSLCDAESAKC